MFKNLALKAIKKARAVSNRGATLTNVSLALKMVPKDPCNMDSKLEMGLNPIANNIAEKMNRATNNPTG